MKNNFLAFLVAILLISGCRKPLNNSMAPQEILFPEVPFIIGAYDTLYSNYYNENCDRLSHQYQYQCSLHGDEVLNFYQREMTLLGWQCTECFTNSDILVRFKKPHRACYIIIKKISAIHSWVIIFFY